MIGIAPIFEPQFGNADAFLGFLMDNQLAHQSITETMRTAGYSVDSIPIGQIEKGQEQDWLFSHAQLHQQIYDQIGLTNMPDLITLDFKDESSYSDWMNRHDFVHKQINITLGL